MNTTSESSAGTAWWRRNWYWVLIAVLVIAGIAVIAAVIWEEPLVNTEARRKARELHELALEKDFDVPSVRQLARLYGVDGGALADYAANDISRAVVAVDTATTGEVNQRPILLDEVRTKVLKYEWLVLQVYRPELQAEYEKWLDQLKVEGKIPE